MNEKIIEHYNNFQIADFDHDMIGMVKAMVDWMHDISKMVSEPLPDESEPENFYKHDPHLPRMELRKHFRNFLNGAVKHQKDDDMEVKLQNLHVCILAGTYIYHMPSKKMAELSKEGPISRQQAQEILLEDNMSPNWIKDPSGEDFSAIML